MEEQETVVQLGRMQVFTYLFLVPLIFTILLTVVLGSALSIFDFSPQLHGAQMWLHNLPLVGAWIPEPAPLISDLDGLTLQRQEIAKEYALLDKYREELDGQRSLLRSREDTFNDILQSYNKQREEANRRDRRIASLVTYYELMKAEEAARIFNSDILEDETCVEILLQMEASKASKLLAAMVPEKAARLSTLIRR